MIESPVLAVIGGSGLYKFSSITEAQSIEVNTPFGKPSSPIVIGSLAGQKVAFLARHGIGHTLLPGEVNYRANIYALKSLGIRRILSVSACGSLRQDYAPGQLVIPDQVFDFTRHRINSFFGEGIVAHVSMPDPYCPDLSAHAYDAVAQTGSTVHKGGSMITIEGPRFSTKSESHTFRAWGMSLIGMTASPEVFLAREAEICYASIAHVTDYDVWHVSEAPVTVEMVINTLNQNLEHVQKAITYLVEGLPEQTSCNCENALSNAIITDPSRILPETQNKLGLLLDKYLKK
jgi:5'-methylthioadenosine phosphorylase